MGNLGNNSLRAIGPPVDDAIATMSRLPVETGGAIRLNSLPVDKLGFKAAPNIPDLGLIFAVLAAITLSISS